MRPLALRLPDSRWESGIGQSRSGQHARLIGRGASYPQLPLPKLKIHHRPGALGRRFQIAIPTTKPLDGPLCNGIFAVSFFLPTYERFLVGPDSQLVDTITQGSGVFRECPLLFLIEAVEAEGFGGGWCGHAVLRGHAGNRRL